jgi:uncharacterized protein (DUF849 family)
VRTWQAAGAIAHLHVLDGQGRPTQDLAAFRRTIALIRERCDIIIEGSTGSLTGFSAADRCVALRAGIEMASLNPGSVNYDQGVYIGSPQDIDYMVREMHRRGIKPGIAIFEAGMIENAMCYIRQGLIAEPLVFNFVPGQAGAMPATARNLMLVVESLPPRRGLGGDGPQWTRPAGGVVGHCVGRPCPRGLRGEHLLPTRGACRQQRNAHRPHRASRSREWPGACLPRRTSRPPGPLSRVVDIQP